MLERLTPGADEFASLRARAEKAIGMSAGEITEMSAERVQRLVHELQVHQIELEMQNEELRRAQGELTQALNRYNELYEFAPVGYATLDSWGVIIEANRTLAEMLGVEAGQLVTCKFSDFVCFGSQDAAYLHRLAVIEQMTQQRCRVQLRRADKRIFPVRLESIGFKESGSEEVRCQVAVLDITEYQQLEDEVLRISEMERMRVSADLHDGICQELAGTQCLLHLLRKELEAQNHPMAADARVIESALLGTTHHTRQVARGMCPLVGDGEGLRDALWSLAETTASSHRVVCSFDEASSVRIDVPLVANELYRIAQEAICNALRHGKADRIRTSLSESDREIRLVVSDNGCGFSGEPPIGPGMGMRIMHHRAELIGGVLAVQSNREGGTDVICRIAKG